jgi:hypothetical protein
MEYLNCKAFKVLEYSNILITMSTPFVCPLTDLHLSTNTILLLSFPQCTGTICCLL